jgi:hypothetical protein
MYNYSFYYYKLDLYSRYNDYLFNTFTRDELQIKKDFTEIIKYDLINDNYNIDTISYKTYLLYIKKYISTWKLTNCTALYLYYYMQHKQVPIISFYEKKIMIDKLIQFNIVNNNNTYINPDILMCYISVESKLNQYMHYFIPIYIYGSLPLTDKLKYETIIENIFNKLGWIFTKLDI